jgi:antitoxin (DNA-binding transcriptional repressor) of toxin-antitoxin stability system
MKRTINAKTLRSQLAKILARVAKGERFTVLYRSRPVCDLVPPDAAPDTAGSLGEDSLYGAGPVGRSRDGKTSRDHDQLLYGS